MISTDRQYRAFDFEQSEEMRVTGVPVVFNSPTVLYRIDGIDFKEVIDRHAFDDVDLSDVLLNVNHSGKAAAKTKNRTLQLEIRDDGIHMDGDLSKNATGRELHEDIKNGFYDKMSFAFTVRESKYDKATRTNTIAKVERLYDISAVDYAAYSQTTLSLRSFFEAEAEKEKMEMEISRRKQELIEKLQKEANK
jgi:HK97 family phage prohead protease